MCLLCQNPLERSEAVFGSVELLFCDQHSVLFVLGTSSC